MALSLNAAPSCKYLSVIIDYGNVVTSTTNVTLEITDINNIDISDSVNAIFSIAPNTGPISYPIPVVNLSITNGLVNIILKTTTGTEIDRMAVLLHCDIDCCLTKLTNELIDCACDCAKCASSLAKAQKIFLLVNSADYAVLQANDGPSSARPGFLRDAYSKYIKAKEICDASCGCDC